MRSTEWPCPTYISREAPRCAASPRLAHPGGVEKPRPVARELRGWGTSVLFRGHSWAIARARAGPELVVRAAAAGGALRGDLLLREAPPAREGFGLFRCRFVCFVGLVWRLVFPRARGTCGHRRLPGMRRDIATRFLGARAAGRRRGGVGLGVRAWPRGARGRARRTQARGKDSEGSRAGWRGHATRPDSRAG